MPKAKAEEFEKLYIPKEGEVLGVVEQMFGFDRVRVRCRDGYVRNARIRGKLRKRMWVREGDVVVISPWPVQGDKRGDVIFRYTRTQLEWLKKRGLWE
jgi:translation initiation factor 1A